MSQPSVACYFGSRKRSAIDDLKLNRAKKVLVLDNDPGFGKQTVESENVSALCSSSVAFTKDEFSSGSNDKFQNKEKSRIILSVGKTLDQSKMQKSGTKKSAPKTKLAKNSNYNMDIQQLLSNMGKGNDSSILPKSEDISSTTHIIERHVTPPNTPNKVSNALDKVKEIPDGPSIKEIKKKMTRSARLADLKASISRFQSNADKLVQVEKKTSQIPESPKLRNFKTIELEVQTSPQKVFSPDKSYLSPRKDSSARRNLIHLLSPTKNTLATLPDSPSKKILLETAKPALTLPYRYRYLAEIFRCIDVVSQILYNRKETITFRKLKPAVEEMLKRNLMEKHLSQIKHIYPEAFEFSQEKLKVFGTGMKQEQWELVLNPKIDNAEHMNSDILLKRRRHLYNSLLDLVKKYHHEFLATLSPPMTVDKDKITRWHPEFNIEKVPEIECSDLPQSPAEEKLTTGKDVLDKARQMFNCNTRMEQALQRLREAREGIKVPEEAEKEVPAKPVSVLKGIPSALLEKVRQKQAAKALMSMTRSADKEKEVLIYSRLPEIARLTRNLFVSEKKSVLPLDVVVEKLGNCYRVHLTKTEMEDHLKAIAKEVPLWLVFHNIRNCVYLKLAKNSDLSVILYKLEHLVKTKSEL
ncbi:unnamed protein product [Phaedon cochleariae]|uniref:CDT1 Geminin-binding domain-containing protein n=1 Tax=Phaedon cochleariae TaxID=80249 RepID=A0A9N9X367_PHACE|nr:unnamed protein product [Phaedon cochleariae]